MRRTLTVLMVLTSLVAGIMSLAGTVTAQSEGDAICADALNGIAPRGYAIVRGSGGGGSQIVLGTDGPDTLSGGTGTDILCGFGGEDVLFGGSGNDILVGGPGSDELYGESGGDTLYGDTTDAVVDGGTGSNRVFRAVVAPPTPTPEPLSPCEQAAVDAGFDPADYINIVSGTEQIDTFTSTAGADLFCGFGGADIFDGELPAGDLLIGGADPDFVAGLNGGTFIGGAGDDFVGSMNGGTFDGGEGTDTVNNYVTGELFNTETPPSGPRP